MSDSVDYQNAGPKNDFSECLHARSLLMFCDDSVDYQNAGSEGFHSRSLSMFCDVRVCYRLMDVVVKAMHTASKHNILLKSLLSDI